MKTHLIYQQLERVANLLRTETRKSGINRNLQPVHVEVLHFLSHCNRFSNTPAVVADFLGLTKGTVSQTLNYLEHIGMIEKFPDLRDRRIVHLRLTSLGDSVICDTIPPKFLQTTLEESSVDEQDLYLQALGKLLRTWQKTNKLRSFGICKSCHYHRVETDGTHFCNLLREILQDDDFDKICREHEY